MISHERPAFVSTDGGAVEVDNVTLWATKPGAQTARPQTLAKLPTQKSKVLRKKRRGQFAKQKKTPVANPR